MIKEVVLNWSRYWILSKDSQVRSILKIFITDPVGKDFRDREKTVYIKSHKTALNRPVDHTGETLNTFEVR